MKHTNIRRIHLYVKNQCWNKLSQKWRLTDGNGFNLFLLVVLLLVVPVLCVEAWKAAFNYILPFLRGEITFLEDFQWFYTAAETFRQSPGQLYGPNPNPNPNPDHPGYYLFYLQRRVGYNYPPPSIFLFLALTKLSVRGRCLARDFFGSVIME